MAGQSSKPDRDGEAQDAAKAAQGAGPRSELRKLLTKDQEAELRELRETRNETRRVTVPALEELLYEAIPVLDHGFVRVVDYMGDDSLPSSRRPASPTAAAPSRCGKTPASSTTCYATATPRRLRCAKSSITSRCRSSWRASGSAIAPPM